jgi:peptide/nickel transport system substrate-binding protein
LKRAGLKPGAAIECRPNIFPKTLLHRSVVSLILAAFIIPSISCRPGGEPDTLVIAIEAPPRGFDPRFSSTNGISARIMQLVYDTLLVKNERFDLVPSLAEKYDESPDHKTFSFRLRSGVTFHNGSPLTSADVKYTFDSLLSPVLKSPIRGSLDKISYIEAPDPLTVIFHAREPFYTFAGNMPVIGIIPEGAGIDIMSAPIGSGPYSLVSYEEGESINLKANPDYWGGTPSISHVQIKVVADNSTRQAELMSGEADMAYNAQFDPETVRALKGRRGVQVVIGDGANIDYLGLNLSRSSALSNQKLRQAIAYAVDRESIIHHLLRDQARGADAIMPPEHWVYDPGVPVYDHDPQRAKQLLDEAGYYDPDGDGPQHRLSITLTTTTNQLSRNIAAILQEQLRRVGIELNLQSLEFATLLDRINRGEFDLYYLRGIGFNQSSDVFQFVYHSRYQSQEFNDVVAKLRVAGDGAQIKALAGQILSILRRREYCESVEVNRFVERAGLVDIESLGSAAIKQQYLEVARLLTDSGGQNRMRYCNPDVDRWISEAEPIDDREKKRELYSKIQRAVAGELPQIYLWYPANVLVASARVDNIQIEPTGSWFFVARLTLKQ